MKCHNQQKISRNDWFFHRSPSKIAHEKMAKRTIYFTKTLTITLTEYYLFSAPSFGNVCFDFDYYRNNIELNKALFTIFQFFSLIPIDDAIFKCIDRFWKDRAKTK